MAKRQKTSMLWHYFTIIDEINQLVKCELCYQKLSYKSTTTNLRKHIRNKHPTVNLQSKPEKRLRRNSEDDDPAPECQPKVRPGLNPHLSPFLTLKKDHKDYPKYNDEPEQETFEEMEIVMKTRSGIEMTYTTRKKKVSFDLRDNILQKVELISKEEIVTLENEKGKYHISAKKNTETKEVVKEKQYETEMMNVIQPSAIINSEENVFDHSNEMNNIRIIEGTVRTAQVEEVIEFCDDEVN